MKPVGGVEINNYMVLYKIFDMPNFTNKSISNQLNVDTYYCDITSLKPGHLYDLEVIAMNSAGKSESLPLRHLVGKLCSALY